MNRKLSNVAARLQTSALFREDVFSGCKFSFSYSGRKHFSHSNKLCIVPAHSLGFGRSPHCGYPNKHVSPAVLMSTRAGLVQQRKPIMERFNDCQSQVNNSRLSNACSTPRNFSSQSKAREDEETKLEVDVDHELDDGDVLENINRKIIFMNGHANMWGNEQADSLAAAAPLDDDIVAINKPYGISVFGSSPVSMNSERPATTLVGVLSQLKDKLNCPDLEVGLSLKSFYSGIVILCKHKNSKKQLEKVLAGAQAQKLQYKTYLAITVGVPQCSHGVDITANIAREYLHNREMSIVSDKYNHTSAKEGTMMQTNFNVQPLVVNNSVGAALVHVTINKDKWEAVEVIMSHYLSPVLGDHIYSRRTQMIRGIPFVASAHASLPGTQKLPLTILEALQFEGDYVDKDLPLSVHCYKVVLNRFPNKSSPPFIITAPPQDKFLTALKCLGLYKETMFS